MKSPITWPCETLGSQQLREGSSGVPIWQVRILIKMYRFGDGFWGWQWLHCWASGPGVALVPEAFELLAPAPMKAPSTGGGRCSIGGSFFRSCFSEAWPHAWFSSLYDSSVAYRVAFFKNPHLERAKERDREGVKHWHGAETSIGCLLYAPGTGIEPTT